MRKRMPFLCLFYTWRITMGLLHYVGMRGGIVNNEDIKLKRLPKNVVALQGWLRGKCIQAPCPGAPYKQCFEKWSLKTRNNELTQICVLLLIIKILNVQISVLCLSAVQISSQNGPI